MKICALSACLLLLSAPAMAEAPQAPAGPETAVQREQADPTLQVSAPKAIPFSAKGEGMEGLAILPPPPGIGSVRFLHDEACYKEGLLERRGPRGERAAKDADLRTMAESFSEAFGLEISKGNTPAIYALLSRAARDLGGMSTRAAKKHYQRVRPFVLYNEPTCLPEEEIFTRKTGSYPSSHSSRSWGMALILAEINPQNREAIFKRGYEIGQSRVICGFHWQSDVDAGRMAAAATVAVLHGNEGFLKAMEKAKAEFAGNKSRAQDTAR